jgi:hypothetical protein
MSWSLLDLLQEHQITQMCILAWPFIPSPTQVGPATLTANAPHLSVFVRPPQAPAAPPKSHSKGCPHKQPVVGCTDGTAWARGLKK